MSIGDNWYVVRALKDGKIQIDNDERDMYHNDIVSGMSVYAAEKEEEAVKYLHDKRKDTRKYGVTYYRDLKKLANFRIQEDFTDNNKGHYLISGITIAEAKNYFSQHKIIQLQQ